MYGHLQPAYRRNELDPGSVHFGERAVGATLLPLARRTILPLAVGAARHRTVGEAGVQVHRGGPRWHLPSDGLSSPSLPHQMGQKESHAG